MFVRRTVTAFAVLVLALALRAQTTFSVSGPGGTFPTSTVGINGVYPHANQTATPSLPPNVFTTSVTVPAGAARITSVVLRGLRHTWAGDAHFVLEDPTGMRFNVACPVNAWNSTIYGTSCDYGASAAGSDYTFVDPSLTALDFPPSDVSPCNGGAYLLPGTYHQYFNAGNGAWPNSAPNNLGVLNVPLQSIAVVPGTWTLRCYDWYLGSQNGTFTSWELHGDLASAPANYCTAGTTSHGCVASIGASGQPHVGHSPACTLAVVNVEGAQTGLLFYGVNNAAFSPQPWGAGSSFLCVKSPLERTGVQPTGGTAGLCDGTLALGWDAFALASPSALGNPWSAGTKLYFQGWFRDPPASKTTNLSDALELTVQP